MSAKPDLLKGIAPIFGKDPCLFISGGGHFTQPDRSVGSKLANGFTLAVDIQPEGSSPSILMGTGVSNKTSLIIHYNHEGIKNRIQCDLQDDRGRMLRASAQLSKYAAKRIIIRVAPQDNNVDLYEFNIHPSDPVRVVEYRAQESPVSFSSFTYDFMFGGACIDGERRGSISTKVSHLVYWARPLETETILKLLASSRRDIIRFVGSDIFNVERNSERHFVFQDDMERIAEFLQKPHLRGAETREAATILYRWLLDRRPMLLELCNELGIQLTLPGETHNTREYCEKEIIKNAAFMFSIVLGTRSLMGHEWVGRRRFLDDTVMCWNGARIRIGAFVKFVRHKLGGAHFDAEDRTKWQRDLTEMTRYWRQDRDVLNHHMREVLTAVWEGVSQNRIAQHIAD